MSWRMSTAINHATHLGLRLITQKVGVCVMHKKLEPQVGLDSNKLIKLTISRNRYIIIQQIVNISTGIRLY